MKFGVLRRATVLTVVAGMALAAAAPVVVIPGHALATIANGVDRQALPDCP